VKGRSSVLRGMLENSESLEKNEDDDVVLRLVEDDEDVTLEVFDLFLTFLYYGSLKDTRMPDGGDQSLGQPSWVEMLPKLVLLADKVISL